uniref:Uncharacterized protein n=1 Tax=Anguilla anguilla TaxID=7936 RepID=A0A0E9SL24_ANGAN
MKYQTGIEELWGGNRLEFMLVQKKCRPVSGKRRE